jgi:predicted  nucleic acid-binding Zn-ribbon protein
MTKSNKAKYETPKIEELIIKLNQIQTDLKHSLLDLHQKIETIDAKPELLNSSLESFKKNAEVRASTLEAEVKQMREQISAVKKLLGLNKEKDITDSD